METRRESVSVAIAGAGGAGVGALGRIMLEAAARSGYYGRLTRLAGSQVRGGGAVSLVTLGLRAIDAAPDAFDLLIAIDWRDVATFADEIPLAPGSVVIGDASADAVPAEFRGDRVTTVAVPLGVGAGGRPEIAALGLAAGIVGLAPEAIEAELLKCHDAPGFADTARGALARGFRHASEIKLNLALDRPCEQRDRRWLASGNQATAAGALRAGVRFVAGYPIAPATGLLEWIQPALERLGGTYVEPEDELAALNMALGAAAGGVPSMMVTAGPGLSLATESIGFAVAAELPVVIVGVQRMGPAIGIPVRSEQGDLNLAVYGAHGDAPRVVLAPTSIADCVDTTAWAVEIAAGFRTPVIVLTDQSLAQMHAVIEAPATHRQRPLATGYRDRPVSDSPEAHGTQLDQLARKLAVAAADPAWADRSGAGECAVIAWGSAVAPTRVAIDWLREDGLNVRFIALRWIAPVPEEAISVALQGVHEALVVEQNHSGQLYRLLASHWKAPARLSSHARAGPLPLRPSEIEAAIIQWSQSR